MKLVFIVEHVNLVSKQLKHKEMEQILLIWFQNVQQYKIVILPSGLIIVLNVYLNIVINIQKMV